jgi:DNA-binding protein
MIKEKKNVEKFARGRAVNKGDVVTEMLRNMLVKWEDLPK